ncbi:hypothetical protein AN640_01640 [Candidatus Epulonipiscium fishelsonii]|uniref:Uncharacterized protein n=1 Tax=Candidatus Epulonipiscium fishelsonii TaxID=77094 RepID=A0ACC8XBC9_9FIRM|nr:hypothetical protein AN640_01640 [Epulopiscium sp. SCG-D08WGA-EpuloA1]OON96134.1 MAG: hypothetical protein ATN32_06670 [Epulopiscium sp. AS2M-Bin002]
MSMSYITYLNLYNKPVSIIIDENIIVPKLLPNEFLSYKKIDEGYHYLNIHQEDTQDLLYTKKINLKPNASFTLIVSFTYDNQAVKGNLISEGGIPIKSEQCFVKIGNFAKKFNSINLICKNKIDEPIYNHNLEYTILSPYIISNPGKFQLIIQDEDNKEYTINLPKFKLYRYYSFYIINVQSSKKYAIMRNIDMVSYKKLDHITKFYV